MRISIIAVFLTLAACVCVPCPDLFAKGLSTTFSEVYLEELETGKTYSTKETANLPLTVINTGEEAVDLKLDLLMPDTSELKEGYEPIPDLAWLQLEKTEFEDVKPNESAVTDVLITIPDDEQYKGKRYQVFIWSRTIGTKIGVGLKSKLLFSIKDDREEIVKIEE